MFAVSILSLSLTMVFGAHKPERVPEGGRVIYKLTESYNLRSLNAKGELEALLLLPPGTKIEIPGHVTEFKAQYITGTGALASEAFISDLEILEIPQMSSDEIEVLNSKELFIAQGLLAHEFRPDESDYLSTQGFKIFRSTKKVDQVFGAKPELESVYTCIRSELSSSELSSKQIRQVLATYESNLAVEDEIFPDDLEFGIDFKALGLRGGKAKVDALRKRRCAVEPKLSAIYNQRYLTLINYGLDARTDRQFVVDLQACAEQKKPAVQKMRVSHGNKSSLATWAKEKWKMEKAVRFSNTDWSKQSSIGYYLTGATYDPVNVAKYIKGLSLYGFESTNDMACTRDIIAHGARYVEDSFINEEGFVGRSWGCPAVERSYVYDGLFDRLRGGSLLVIFRGESGILN